MTLLRTAALIAIALAGSTAVPATAQDGPPPPPPGAHGGGWQGNWQGQWQAPDNRVYNGTWSGTYERGGYPYPGGPMSQMDGPPPEGPMRGWGPPRDEHWQRMVERCSSDHRGGKIGGAVIGGVAGGVIGNRLADGNRTLGTVVGAGAGALGGAAVGGAIDRGHDRECDEFFRLAGPGGAPDPGGPGGWGPPPGPGFGAGFAPGGYGYMWVPVMIQGGGRGYTETVTRTEEFFDGGARRLIDRKPARIIHRAPPSRVHDKRVYIGGR
jgi:hypothetical protein